MTRHLLPGRNRFPFRRFLRAHPLGMGAARVEAAAWRWLDGGGDVAFEHDAVALVAGVRQRDRRNERSGVRMAGLVVDFVR